MKSIIQDESLKICYLCGGYGSDRHHCLHGSMRAKADKWGLVVMLCRTCHRNLHDKRVNDLYLQQIAEKAWLEHNHADIDAFIKEFGKNYL